MVKQYKFILAFLLALAILSPLVSAACPGGMLGDGNSTSPCQINNWTQLNATREDMTLDYKLMRSLKPTQADYAGIGDTWFPLGDEANEFTGNFDGNKKTISNLTINSNYLPDPWPNSYRVGFIGKLRGSIKDLGIINLYYEKKGESQYGTDGGMVASLLGTIDRCYTTGVINNSFGSDGGLVGGVDDGAIVNNSYSEVVLYGKDAIGGLVGYVSGGAVYNSYAIGNVTSSNSFNAGGFTGYSAGGGNIQNSYSTGYVNGAASYRGGFMGYTQESSITNSGWWAGIGLPAAIGVVHSGGFPGYDTFDVNITYNETDKSVFYNSSHPIYSTWDFSTPIWYERDGDYPKLNPEPVFCDEDGDGTAGNPYQICTWTQLNNTRNNLSAYYILNNNLDSSTDGYAGIGNSWIPMGFCNFGLCGEGGAETPFSGAFNGAGYTISNLSINRSGDIFNGGTGLFGYITGNVSNTNVEIDILVGETYAGGLVGYNDGSIDNCSSTIVGLVNSPSYFTGGLVGRNNGKVNNSYAIISGNITGAGTIGGLIGDIDGGASVSLSNSYSILSGIITSTGGNRPMTLMTGTNSNITNCYSIIESTGKIYSSIGAGFLTATSNRVINSYMFVRSEYGNITFSANNVIGNMGNMNSTYIRILNNSAFVNSSSNPGINKSAEVTLNLAGWDFVNPRILRDGLVCSAPNCNILSYNGTTGILVFNVTGWSNYTIEEITIPPVPPLPGCDNVISGFTAFNDLLPIIVVLSFAIIALGMFFGLKEAKGGSSFLSASFAEISPMAVVGTISGIIIVGLMIVVGIVIVSQLGGC